MVEANGGMIGIMCSAWLLFTITILWSWQVLGQVHFLSPQKRVNYACLLNLLSAFFLQTSQLKIIILRTLW